MLLQKCEWEPVEPRKILPCGLVPRSRVDLAIGHIEDPVTAVLNPPMTANRACKCLYPQRQTAAEVSHLLGGLPRTDSCQLHEPKRGQATPVPGVRQFGWSRELENLPCFFPPKAA